MIVIVEISRSPHDGFQFIQTSMAGHLKPRKFADRVFGEGGMIVCSAPDRSEAYSVHLYLRCSCEQRRCDFCS